MRSPHPLLFSKYIPSTLIDTVHHPVWGLSSRYFERASIIRWQSICEGAPPVFILALSPRAAERDTPSTSTRGLGSSWEVEEVEGKLWVKVGLLRSPYEARSRLSYPEAVDHPDQARGVSDNRLDQARRSIGSLPIMGRTLPITVKEPTEEVGDRRDQGSDRAAADRERGLDKRETTLSKR